MWEMFAWGQRQHIIPFLSDTVMALGKAPFRLVSVCFLPRFKTAAAVIGYQMNSRASVNIHFFCFFTPHSPRRLTTTWHGTWTAPWRETTGTFWSFTTSASTTSATSADHTVRSSSPSWWRWTTSWRRFTGPSFPRSAIFPTISGHLQVISPYVIFSVSGASPSCSILRFASLT